MLRKMINKKRGNVAEDGRMGMSDERDGETKEQKIATQDWIQGKKKSRRVREHGMNDEKSA